MIQLHFTENLIFILCNRLGENKHFNVNMVTEAQISVFPTQCLSEARL